MVQPLSNRVRASLTAVALSGLLAVIVTWPLAARFGTGGRVDSGDGRHGVWNVAWVAHSLTTDPGNLFHANIFFPARNALAFSEANLVAGTLALPAWLASDGNPYAAFNSVVLMAFAFAAMSAYFLARTLGAGRPGAAIAGIVYGGSPYMLAHTAHIQLLMTWGLALSAAMLIRFGRLPTTGRATALGATLGLTGLACAYYGIFAGLIAVLGVIWFAATERRWQQPAYWARAALGAAIASLIILPFFLPYLAVRDAGFERSLQETRLYSASLREYLASAVHVHRWMLPWLGQWREVLFPGFLASLLAGSAVVLLLRRPDPSGAGGSRRSEAGFVIAMMVLAFWISTGPAGGLYTLLYETVPAFSFLRAPARMGVVVTLGVAVLSALAITWLSERRRWSSAVIALATVVVSVETWAGPFELADGPRVHRVYAQLGRTPRSSVVEFPFYHGAYERHRQTEYMLMSTFHWQPLVNGYSDHFPAGYIAATPVLADFPSAGSLDLIRDMNVRWVVVHFYRYPPQERESLRETLRSMTDRLREAIDDPESGLYEVIGPAQRRTGAERR